MNIVSSFKKLFSKKKTVVQKMAEYNAMEDLLDYALLNPKSITEQQKQKLIKHQDDKINNLQRLYDRSKKYYRD